ncbi:hypothetical protein ACJU26_05680 [Acidithiobacillus sp. M4-SHS-6]|uniref:hypothetical protein n=1 Tax=Acidithiobacillus sp. M4-SHS-6 TaxID=3383024 RepID=UPI0039BE606E
MEVMELIQQSQAVADLAWDAVKASDPRRTGLWERHADVTEGDHHYARDVLSGKVRAQEYNGVQLTPEMIESAKDLVNFLQYRVGWGDPHGTGMGPSANASNAILNIAALMQYQNRIVQKQQMGMAGQRPNKGMEALLLQFASGHPVGHPETIIQKVREKLDPLFEDGLRLSDHQRMFGGAVPAVAHNPQLDQLAKKLLDDANRHDPVPVQARPVKAAASDPWGLK